jgi:hypothetical protein
MSIASCRMAAAALEHALQDEPGKIYADLAEAVRCLVRLRDELIAEQHASANRGDLDRCNAILSMVIGSEYPLAGIRRDRVQQALQELSALCGGSR